MRTHKWKIMWVEKKSKLFQTCFNITVLGYVIQFVINVIVGAQWKVNNVYLLTVKR